jgi:hypothetical protein
VKCVNKTLEIFVTFPCFPPFRFQLQEIKRYRV